MSPNLSEERAKNLERAFKHIQARYGAGAIMRLDGQVPTCLDDAISTGSMLLDEAVGIGGLPRGRMVEIFGPESSGKTTVALHAIASVQAEGGVAAFVDAEHALDASYASRIGVKLPQLLLSQPDSGEQALEITKSLVESGAVDLVVVDSVAALTPEAEIEGEMGDLQVGLQARMMSKAMRKLTGLVSRTRCCVLFINQLRSKVGVTFGPREVTTGGNALKYYTSLRLDIRRIGAVKQGEDAIGNRTKVKVVKNKLAPPFRVVEFDIVFGRGICPAAELLELGEAHGLVSKSGNWYAFGDEKLGNGKQQARKRLVAEPELALQLRQLILATRAPQGDES